MNDEQFEKMAYGTGFIAALDQSGGSTPGALEHYGIGRDAYGDESEMLSLMHEMRSRIITDPSFTGERVVGAILFEDTMDRQIGGLESAAYLWRSKRVVPFLKVDKGLAPESGGVRLMNPIPDLDALLAKAVAREVFGTKMRSFIHLADPSGIEKVLDQQFEVARQIAAAGLVPILEPEVDIHSPDKEAAETILRDALAERLDRLSTDEHVMLKLTLPERDNLYAGLIDHHNVLRVVALSGGYQRDEACERLARNRRMIASFSRALTEGLRVDQSDREFSAELESAIEQIYTASIT